MDVGTPGRSPVAGPGYVLLGTERHGIHTSDSGDGAFAQVLQGKASLVSGPTSGTGRAVATLFAQEGAEDGLETPEEALELVERTEERLNEAELHRLKGEILLQQAQADNSRLAEAEACFQQAIAVARQMLSAIYGWFTEGFDTPDLQEAQALLAALSAPAADTMEER